MMFTNTLKLTKFMLRRERTTSTAWILAMTITNLLIVLLMGVVLLPDADSRAQMMGMLENPILLAMVGPLHPYAYDSIGALYTLMMFVFMGITVGIMNVFLIVRHTRADEESGRYEVLRSLPCGRLANVNAAMLTAVVVNTIMAVVFTLTMWVSMGLANEPMGFGAALLWGTGMGVLGLVFAAVAALFSQISSTARGASAYSFAMLGLFYFLRAGADMDPEAMGYLAYLSPLGLLSRTWAYVENSWLPVVILLGYAAGFTALAYRLCSLRDIDQGLFPARPGKAHGSRLMQSSFGLNFRLLRLSIIVWMSVLFIVGFSYAVVLADIDTFIAGNELYRDMILGPTGLTDYFNFDDMPTEQIIEQMNTVLGTAGLSVIQLFANMISFVMAMMALVPVLMFILKAKAEEKAIRAELIFATRESRTKYLAGLVVISFACAVLVQLAQAIGLYSMVPSMLDNPSDLPLSFLLQSVMVYVPALWIMGGLAVLMVGLFPKRVGWIWAYYGFTFFVMMYARMLPEIAWLANLTPLGWVPQLPMDEINGIVMALMSVGGIALAAVGIMFYNRRDINAITH